MSLQRPLERLRPLLASFAASDLTHFELRDGDFALEFIRRKPPHVGAAPALPVVAPVAAAPEVTERIVRAELVGVLHWTKPLISLGSQLEGDRQVATIEALGVNTPVRAGGSGVVTRVLVNDGDAVDYGQALFVVERV